MKFMHSVFNETGSEPRHKGENRMNAQEMERIEQHWTNGDNQGRIWSINGYGEVCAEYPGNWKYFSSVKGAERWMKKHGYELAA